MRIVYKTKDYLAHALTAEQQRANYDSQARHERYIRDRDAGKTGYQGIQAKGPIAQNGYSNGPRMRQQSTSTGSSSTTSGSYSYSGRRSRYNSTKRNSSSIQRQPTSPQTTRDQVISGLHQQINNLNSMNPEDKQNAKEAIKRRLEIVRRQIEDTSERVKAILKKRGALSEASNKKSVKVKTMKELYEIDK